MVLSCHIPRLACLIDVLIDVRVIKWLADLIDGCSSSSSSASPPVVQGVHKLVHEGMGLQVEFGPL